MKAAVLLLIGLLHLTVATPTASLLNATDNNGTGDVMMLAPLAADTDTSRGDDVISTGQPSPAPVVTKVVRPVVKTTKKKVIQKMTKKPIPKKPIPKKPIAKKPIAKKPIPKKPIPKKPVMNKKKATKKPLVKSTTEELNTERLTLGCDGVFAVYARKQYIYYRRMHNRWLQMSCFPENFNLDKCRCASVNDKEPLENSDVTRTSTEPSVTDVGLEMGRVVAKNATTAAAESSAPRTQSPVLLHTVTALFVVVVVGFLVDGEF